MQSSVKVQSFGVSGLGFRRVSCKLGPPEENATTSHARALVVVIVDSAGVRPCKETLMGAPNREPQEYSKTISYIPIIFLLYSWGSLFRVPIKVPLTGGVSIQCGHPL